MRQIRRAPLSEQATELMAQCQTLLDRDPALVPGDQWRASRRKLVEAGVLSTLERMAGNTARCFYCCDSRGADIEHFRPKSRPEWRNLVFVWTNLLLCCTTCGRKKGDRFPLDNAGRPLLIDPTLEDPWLFLVFDEENGQLVPRQLPNGAADARGCAVADGSYLPLNDEKVTQGRRRAWRVLRDATQRLLRDEGSEDELLEAVEHAEERGIGTWSFIHEGAMLDPFATLFALRPATAERVLAWIRAQHR